MLTELAEEQMDINRLEINNTKNFTTTSKE